MDGSTDGLPERRRGRAVGEDLRAAAVAAVLREGMSTRAAARRFGLPRSSVGVWVKRFRERGHVRPDRKGGRPARIDRARLPAYVGTLAARWESGYPSDCKSAYTGSNPVRASSPSPSPERAAIRARIRVCSAVAQW